MRLITPARRRGAEILDDATLPADVRARSMADVARSNALFGGSRSALRALRELFPLLPHRATLLDVGTGTADIPERARREARPYRIDFTAIGVDTSASVLASARPRLTGVVAGDARRLPFADDTFDVVTCSQVLHHFFGDDVRTLILEMHRVSRRWVIVSDLRRSWFAAAGFWVASVGLRFHSVTRHDGVLSVLRGFTPRELSTAIESATGRVPQMRPGAFWRLSATWDKRSFRTQ